MSKCTVAGKSPGSDEVACFASAHALVIGVAGYKKVSPLPASVLQDARDFASLLRDPDHCGYLPEHVHLLLDDEATADRIRDELRQLAQDAGLDSTAVIFFSGHGGRIESGPHEGNYLRPYNYDPADLSRTAISGKTLTDMLNAIHAPRLLAFFDCCYSGGTGETKGVSSEADGFIPGFEEAYYRQLAQGKGRVIMASSRPDEDSLVLTNMENSLFTHYLLEALRGQAHTRGDGLIRVFDVFDYVSVHVPTRGSQHPVFKAGDLENNFPIALYKGRAKSEPMAESSLTDRWWQQRGYRGDPFGLLQAEDAEPQQLQAWHVDCFLPDDRRNRGMDAIDSVIHQDEGRPVIVYAPPGGGKTFYRRLAAQQCKDRLMTRGIVEISMPDLAQARLFDHGGFNASNLARCVLDKVIACHPAGTLDPRDTVPDADESPERILSRCAKLVSSLPHKRSKALLYVFLDDLDRAHVDAKKSDKREAGREEIVSFLRSVANRAGGPLLALRIFLPLRWAGWIRERLGTDLYKRCRDERLLWTPERCEEVIERRLDAAWRGKTRSDGSHRRHLLGPDALTEFTERLKKANKASLSVRRVIEELATIVDYAIGQGIIEEPISMEVYRRAQERMR